MKREASQVFRAHRVVLRVLRLIHPDNDITVRFPGIRQNDLGKTTRHHTKCMFW